MSNFQPAQNDELPPPYSALLLINNNNFLPKNQHQATRQNNLPMSPAPYSIIASNSSVGPHPHHQSSSSITTAPAIYQPRQTAIRALSNGCWPHHSHHPHSCAVAVVYQQQPPAQLPAPSSTIFIHQQGLPRPPDVPALMICPHCQRTVTTIVRQQASLLAWFLCWCLLLFGCWLGCCLIPLCMLKAFLLCFANFFCKTDTDHLCPNCRCVIWRY